MDLPNPEELIDRVRKLPAARPLLARLGEEPGVHLVGGAVRDLLLGGAPTDLDLVIEGEAAALGGRLGAPSRQHDRFGTLTLVIDGYEYDIAGTRTERYPRPGALPVVAPGSLEQDLLRRDFTVNAAAIALSGPRPGTLRSAPGMLQDLDARLLRVLHERSFLDDPTRLLRLVRYSTRLGFDVEPHTRELAQAAVERGALATVTRSRIGSELRLLAGEPDPVAAFAALREYGLDAKIGPAFGLDDPALARRALNLLPSGARRDRLAIATAALSVPRAALGSLLDALGFTAADREAIVTAANEAAATASALSSAQRPSEVARAVGGGRVELVALAGALGPAAAARQWLEQLRHVQLEIDGADLLAAGVPEGPAIGEGLRAARAAKLDGRICGREQELAEALRAAR